MNGPSSVPRFIADDMLGRLARWLRLLGFDVVYAASMRDADLVEQALREDRVILTRDTRLVERKSAKKYILIRDDRYPAQVAQVIEELKLKVTEEDIFTRCLLCNRLIEDIDRKEVKGLVPAYVYRTQERFRRCPGCKRIYWAGTHLARARENFKRMSVKVI